ncbi:MAG: YoaP domain-containing protein [Tannerellaceae bacterium]
MIKNAPTPTSIFSVFYNGKFLTTDMSLCTESRFMKMLGL